jgi:hypothetical protein
MAIKFKTKEDEARLQFLTALEASFKVVAEEELSEASFADMLRALEGMDDEHAAAVAKLEADIAALGKTIAERDAVIVQLKEQVANKKAAPAADGAKAIPSGEVKTDSADYQCDDVLALMHEMDL